MKKTLKLVSKLSLLLFIFVACFTLTTRFTKPLHYTVTSPKIGKKVNFSLENSSKSSKPKQIFRILPYIPSKIKEKRIVLERKNTLIFREVVTMQSVSRLQMKLLKLDASLPKNTPIFLVLDTPGGSVTAGSTLIDMINAMDHEVETISLFSASMGFHIVQNLGKRYITPSGILMSHRMKIVGLGGEVPGEAVVRMNWMLRTAYKMDERVSKRIGMPIKNYRELIRDEYWVIGQDAVDAHMADSIANVTCGKDMFGTYKDNVRTFFGSLKLTWSNCPLIRYPLKVNSNNLWIFRSNENHVSKEELEDIIIKRKMVKDYINTFLTNKKAFVNDYILTGNYRKILK